MTKVPYLTLNNQKKTFTFNAGDNKLLQYLSEDDALFVSLSIYENISICFAKNELIDKEIIEQLVFIGEQYAFERLKKGIEMRQHTMEYLLSYLKRLDLPRDRAFINKINFQFRGINIIMSDLTLSEKHKNNEIERLLKKFDASLEIKRDKANILCHVYIIEFLFLMFELRINLKPKFGIKLHRKTPPPYGKLFRIWKF